MQIVLYILQKVLDKNRMKQFTTNALQYDMTWSIDGHEIPQSLRYNI